MYLDGGLPQSPEVHEKHEDYRASMDTIGQWIEDCAIVADGVGEMYANLYESYKDWCKTYNQYMLDGRAFMISLVERNFTKGRNNRGVFLRGIALKTGN